uniref:Uncharacterized protein n=1 Tax=Aegilops tauschii subsp. strangulata TaxID=200361 RepID=A0A453NJY0_AEGTS
FSCHLRLIRQPDSLNELAPDLLENSSTAGTQLVYWDSKVSVEDLDGMWSQPDVLKEWTNSGERRGNVRFSHDAKKRPYLSRVEVKAVAEIIISRHFSSRGVKPGSPSCSRRGVQYALCPWSTFSDRIDGNRLPYCRMAFQVMTLRLAIYLYILSKQLR